MGRPFIINDETIYYKLNCDFSIKGKKFSICQKRPKRVFLLFDLADSEFIVTQ